VLDGLFGSKPSDKMISATVSYRSGSITALGGNLTGEKYSKENQDAAKQTANMVRKLQNATGGYLVDGICVQVGSRDGIKLHMEKDAKPVRFSDTASPLNAAWQHMFGKLKGGDRSKISTIKFATGDSIFTRRTLLEVGEAGPERVQVSKLGGSYGDGGGGITTNINIQGRWLPAA
jgi:hypothetical protein